MPLFNKSVLLIMLASGIVLGHVVQADTWTDKTGKFRVEAKFKSVSGGKVVLEKEDGKEISVPINQLSAESLEQAKRLFQASKTGETITPAMKPADAAASPAYDGTMSELVEASPHVAFREFINGMSNSVLAGTVAEDRSVPWTKPDDIVLDDTFLTKDNTFVEGNFMFADGRIMYVHLEPDLDKAKFRAMFDLGEPQQLNELYPADYKFTYAEHASPQERLKHTKARMEVSNAMKKIALGLHNYHAVHKHLPPAIVYGPNGKPWHSWRVLILPYLGEEALYKQYDHSVPWDDPKNAAVLKAIPKVYRDPLATSAASNKTPYLVASGPGTAFPTKEVK